MAWNASRQSTDATKIDMKRGIETYGTEPEQLRGHRPDDMFFTSATYVFFFYHEINSHRA
jgi:hypothetical protein